VVDVLEGIPVRPQRQDDLRQQLRDLERVANRLGMFDAADYLRAVNIRMGDARL